MSNIAIFPPSKTQLDAMPLVASVQYFDPKPASAINRLFNGLFPNALYDNFTLEPKLTGLTVTVLAAGGLALVKTLNGESIKVEGQHNIDVDVVEGVNYIYLVANFQHNTITSQVDTSSAINPADVIVSADPQQVGQLLGTVTVPLASPNVTAEMISYDGVKRFSFRDFAQQGDFLEHNHDGRYLPIKGKAVEAGNADRFGGAIPSYFAKASQVLTNVPENAVFTDTQTPLSDSIASTSTTTAASSMAAKTAYDKGAEALAKANSKLDQGAQAADSALFGGQAPAHYAKASQVLTDVPAGAVFTDTWRGLVDSLVSTSTTESLTANQGRILKGMIDQINTLVSSDDTTLNELQEIVNFIKQNKADLNSLGILNIAGLQAALDDKLSLTGTAANSHLFTGKTPDFFAKASQVLTDVPAGAVFTDTNTFRPISDSVISESMDVSASSKAVKVAYDRGTEALEVANTKLSATATAADSAKLGGIAPSGYVKAEQVLTNVPANALFTDTQTPLSDSLALDSSTTAASSKAVMLAYQRAQTAADTIAGKLDDTETAADSHKLAGKLPSAYVQTTGDQHISGKKSFDGEIGFGATGAIRYDAPTDSIVFIFE